VFGFRGRGCIEFGPIFSYSLGFYNSKKFTNAHEQQTIFSRVLFLFRAYFYCTNKEYTQLPQLIGLHKRDALQFTKVVYDHPFNRLYRWSNGDALACGADKHGRSED